MATATYDLIASQTLGSAASSITFSSIAASWTDLRVVLIFQGGAANSSRYYFNNDTTALYSQNYMYGDGTSTATGSINNQSYLYMSTSLGAPTTNFALVTIDVFSYAGSTYKTVLETISDDRNGSGMVYRNSGLYRSTSAINRIDFTINGTTLAAGTTASLYGIKAA